MCDECATKARQEGKGPVTLSATGASFRVAGLAGSGVSCPNQIATTFSAAGPFCPCTTSNSTF